MTEEYVQFLRRAGELRVDLALLALNGATLNDSLFNKRCKDMNMRIHRLERSVGSAAFLTWLFVF